MGSTGQVCHLEPGLSVLPICSRNESLYLPVDDVHNDGVTFAIHPVKDRPKLDGRNNRKQQRLPSFQFRAEWILQLDFATGLSFQVFQACHWIGD